METIIYYIKRLGPPIGVLLQSLSEIASIWAEMQDAIDVEKTVEAKPTAAKKTTTAKISKVIDVKATEVEEASSEEAEETVTVEQIRAVLAEKSQAGLTRQVKELLNGYGAEKLSAVDPAKYPELIRAAKALA